MAPLIIFIKMAYYTEWLVTTLKMLKNYYTYKEINNSMFYFKYIFLKASVLLPGLTFQFLISFILILISETLLNIYFIHSP